MRRDPRSCAGGFSRVTIFCCIVPLPKRIPSTGMTHDNPILGQDKTRAGCGELWLVFRHTGLSAFFLAADQAEFFSLVTESIAADIEQLGGVSLVTVGLVHG